MMFHGSIRSRVFRHACAFALMSLAAASTMAASGPDALRAGFQQPPAQARPQTLWFWMNGNITHDGITRDLEAMKRIGLGGAMIFEGGIYIPRGPVDYLSPAWRDALAHTTREAARLGLDVGMHNAPGWSSSGGPWITPELSMKQLVWTETTVTGPGLQKLNLGQPFIKEGFYRDAFVLAFPAPTGEEKPYQERLKHFTTSRGDTVNAATLIDGNLSTGIPTGPQNAFVLEFAEPFEARAITVCTAAGAPNRRVNLESSDDGAHYQPVVQVRLSPPRGIEFPGANNFPPVRARFYRVSTQGETTIAELNLHHAPRIEDWNYKGNFAFRIPKQTPAPVPQEKQFSLDPEQVRDLTSRMNAGGQLEWDVPPGSWGILRLGYTSTGQRNIAAPTAGSGLECDKFSREAIEKHFQSVQETVLKAIGPEGRGSFVRVEIDSYEAEMQNWTAAFPEEFRKRNGYDLVRFLPAMTGRIVGDAGVSDRFLFDVRRTQAALMAENYYGRMGELCRARGLQFYVEPYGPGPYDELQIGGMVDVPMTEFWTRTPWGPNRVVKSVSSDAHIYGKRIVAAEAFTGEEETSRWLDYPYAMKTLGDLMFSLGYNQTFFHRCAHQPHPDAAPGMAMGPWGMNLDRVNTWFDKSGGWMNYLARSQHLLQQGRFVADVLWFGGERSPESAQYVFADVPAGHTYDLVNADVLLNRVKISDGRIVLPEGASYRVLVLPEDLRGMTPELLKRLDDLVQQGMILVGPKPTFNLTLRGGSGADTAFYRMADEMWGSAAGDKSRGKGRIYANTPLADVLRQTGVSPDFEFTSRNPDGAVVWLHRQLDDGDLYFVANRQRRDEDIVCSFRVTGRQPELWDAQTGEIQSVAIFSDENGRLRLPLHLDPAQSVFVVLRSPATAAPARSLTRDGETILTSKSCSTEPGELSAGLTNTFTISVWVKPDITLRGMPQESTTGRIEEAGKFYAVPARDGEALFGPGNAIAGIAAGRNGVYVLERSSRNSPAVLVARESLSGWTHLAVAYENGRPSLYINGKFVRKGLASGLNVHPGAGVPPGSGVTYYFEGEMTRPDVFPQSLDAEQIQAIAKKGLPLPQEPCDARLALRSDGRVDALLWQSGAYKLDNGPASKVEVPRPVTVAGPWQVTFPAGRGAPASIVMPELISLHRHSDPGVRFFSGTAIYSNTLHLTPEAFAAGRRVFLDLGRVEVIAEVRINGREAGQLWKAPWRLDITEVARPGNNTVEIQVTTLWANRLIGDEQLPKENEYDRAQHNIVRLPEWYVKGEPKPTGGRTTFATWHFYEANEPLLESGLLGPVRVFNPVQCVLERGE